MNRRLAAKMQKEQGKAVDKYIEVVEQSKAYLERISEYLEDFGERSPDEVTWASVGSMVHMEYQLKQLKDMIDGTGEYSD